MRLLSRADISAATEPPISSYYHIVNSAWLCGDEACPDEAVEIQVTVRTSG